MKDAAVPLTTADLLNESLLLDVRYVQSAMAAASKDMQQFAHMLFPIREQSSDRHLENSVAVISVHGSLFHRGWRSYEWIEADFKAAMENPQVKGIVFDIDSPGGVVPGAFDLSDLIFESRSEKPMLAIVNERACSGAYVIASACDSVSVSRTAETGSVGVVRTHWDISGSMERWGESVTLIFAGSHKVDGNPFGPLPENVKNRFQAEVSETYGLFVNTVARNRAMSLEDVRATEALVYTGQAAVDVGFADSVKSSSEAMAEFIDRVNQISSGEPIMKIKVADLKKNLEAEGVSEEVIAKLELPENDQEEIELEEDQQQSPPNSNVETPPADDELDAGSDRDRIKAILQSDAAEKRQELANHFALETDMSAEHAIAALEKSPEQVLDPLAAAMINGGADIGDDDQSDMNGDQKVSSSWETAIQKTGGKLKTA